MSRIKLNSSKFMTRIHITHQPLALDHNAHYFLRYVLNYILVVIFVSRIVN